DTNFTRAVPSAAGARLLLCGRIYVLVLSGSIDMKNFGCWLQIGSDGLYVNIDHENEVDLTPEEAATLCPHPTGNLDEPALPFPFSIGELESFLDFTNEEGRDVPLSRKKFEEIIALKSLKRKSTQASVLRQQERAPLKDTETKPDFLRLQAHEDEVSPMPEAAPAVAQPPQKYAPRDDEEANPENPQMVGLNKINNAKKELGDRARTHAQSIWDADDTRQEFTLKDVAEQVEDILRREGATGLPSRERIKDWIRPVAPEYARKGGRPRKTP
ncbi:hypothetical protein SAMN04244572_04833, partial [Azotobacter beijerinckii]